MLTAAKNDDGDVDDDVNSDNNESVAIGQYGEALQVLGELFFEFYHAKRSGSVTQRYDSYYERVHELARILGREVSLRCMKKPKKIFKLDTRVGKHANFRMGK